VRTLKIWVYAAASVVMAAMSLEAQAPPGRGGPGRGGRPPGGGIGRPGPADQTVVDPVKAEAGKKIYVQHCAFCHGTDAGGGESGGADLIRSAVVARDRYGEEIGKLLASGVPDKGMPPFKLAQTQVEEIAHFIHQRVYERAHRNTYSIQNVLTGHAKAGEAYFNGAGKCNTCHSPTKDLAGIGKKYDPLALQQRFLFPRGGGRGGPSGPATTATVTPPSGPPVTGALVFMDDFNVAIRDASGQHRSWRRVPGLKVDVKDPLAAHIEMLDRYTDADMHNIVAYLETLK
jgi:mono/diheme cytochrome c family protein